MNDPPKFAAVRRGVIIAKGTKQEMEAYIEAKAKLRPKRPWQRIEWTLWYTARPIGATVN